MKEFSSLLPKNISNLFPEVVGERQTGRRYKIYEKREVGRNVSQTSLSKKSVGYIILSTANFMEGSSIPRIIDSISASSSGWSFALSLDN